MSEGWIKLYRQLIVNPLMRKPNYLAVWIYLLMSANHEETTIIWNRKKTVIKKGSFIGSLRKIGEHFGIGIATVKYIVDYFVSEQMIEHYATKKFSVFTILNWSKYQGVEQSIEHKVKSKLNQSETNKNDNNVKNEKNNIPSDANVAEIINLFKEVNPTYQRLFGNKTERGATERLLKQFPRPQLDNLVALLSKTNALPAGTRITTPYQLEKDMGKLKAVVEQQRAKQGTKGKTIIQ